VRSRWSDREAAEFVGRYGAEWGEELALRAFSSRLLGQETSLVLHGGGNTSLKSDYVTILGERPKALWVKGSGLDLSTIEPDGFAGLDLAYLLRLRALSELDDATMSREFRGHMFRPDGPAPSIEALVHAFLPAVYVDHTHADAVLALTNRPGGEELVREALGGEVLVLPYITPGFELALAAASALETHPAARAMVWSHHGIVTWGQSARESYEAMIEYVSRAEAFAGGRSTRTSAEQTDGCSTQKLAQVMPLVRGLLAEVTGDADRPRRPLVLQALSGKAVLEALAMPGARDAFVSPPLTSDHLIRTKALPLWVDLAGADEGSMQARLVESVADYVLVYESYLSRHGDLLPEGIAPFDARPRVVLTPGIGAICAGRDLREATIARDITEHTLAVKAAIGVGAEYEGMPERELFRMEYRGLQLAKLAGFERPLGGRIALVTGAAGAIGAGICEGLLEQGCLVAATDLPGDPLKRLVAGLGEHHPGAIVGITMDVTCPDSVAAAFEEVALRWGGVDLVVANAGIAMVAPLVDLDLEAYRRLERVNVEGTLLVIAEAARLLKRQAIGGDIVLISTKNVFAPGANFGAYSSTKAAAHQLARIASLELAGDDIRVNMVAPDAVFGHGRQRSGLWAEVGPDRMKARGLDEAGLEAYYQSRNLLKARVTADHVARAVMFFATRQTPTTGATIPVDGGLPDSTPR